MHMEKIQEIAAKYQNKVFKKFINVYQLQYKDFKPPGFGDYLRGCIHMAQVLRILNKHCGTEATYDMDMSNHPIGKYLDLVPVEPCKNYPALGNYFIDSLEVKDDPADVCYQHILDCVIRYFNKVQEETHYAFCCKFQVLAKTEEADKEFIRSRLVPNAGMRAYIDETMAELGLATGEFSVIHVRVRDEVSFKTRSPLDAKRLAGIATALAPHIDPAKKYLLITNHDDIKTHYNGRPNIISKNTKICHLGQDSEPSEEATRDTMLDFFLMARSNNIVAYSEYNFSGFSLECSKLYNIPYVVMGPPKDPPGPPGPPKALPGPPGVAGLPNLEGVSILSPAEMARLMAMVKPQASPPTNQVRLP